MTDRSIIFSAPMVRALIEGRKTQTRRILKPTKSQVARWSPNFSICPSATIGQHADYDERWVQFEHPGGGPYTAIPLRPDIGDRLWVRETWAKVGDADDDVHACPDMRIHAYYRADQVDPERQRWRSPIHMPRWASRLTLTVIDARVQRLQDISEADAIAEGLFQSLPTEEDLAWAKARAEEDGGDPEMRPVWTIPGTDCGFGPKPRVPLWGPTPQSAYMMLWNHIHGPAAWDANPWVTAISFDVAQHNIDAGPSA